MAAEQWKSEEWNAFLESPPGASEMAVGDFLEIAGLEPRESIGTREDENSLLACELIICGAFDFVSMAPSWRQLCL